MIIKFSEGDRKWFVFRRVHRLVIRWPLVCSDAKRDDINKVYSDSNWLTFTKTSNPWDFRFKTSWNFLTNCADSIQANKDCTRMSFSSECLTLMNVWLHLHKGLSLFMCAVILIFSSFKSVFDSVWIDSLWSASECGLSRKCHQWWALSRNNRLHTEMSYRKWCLYCETCCQRICIHYRIDD